MSLIENEKDAQVFLSEDLKKNEKIRELIRIADRNLEAIGYTEHGFRHVENVSRNAGKILADMGYDEHLVHLAQMAGYLHDIGNVVNRRHHAYHSAHIIIDVLPQIGVPFPDVLEIAAAAGNHHEEDGDPVSVVGAALIIADKADVHKSRVRSAQNLADDIHDRVNYAVQQSELTVLPNKIISLSLLIDPSISSVMEYFEIFMTRMIESRRSARFLGCNFEIAINGVRLT